MYCRSCLLLPGSNTTDDVQLVYMGQRYKADKQCQLLYGPESFYCGVRRYTLLSCYQVHSDSLHFERFTIKKIMRIYHSFCNLVATSS